MLWKSSLGLAPGLFRCSQTQPYPSFCLNSLARGAVPFLLCCSGDEVVGDLQPSLLGQDPLRLPELGSPMGNPRELLGVVERRCLRADACSFSASAQQTGYGGYGANQPSGVRKIGVLTSASELGHSSSSLPARFLSRTLLLFCLPEFPSSLGICNSFYTVQIRSFFSGAMFLFICLF